MNLYTASVVALDPDSGKLRWHFQEIPNDVWDFDSAYECILMDRMVSGRMRKLLVHMNKSGATFVLDRVRGEFVRAFCSSSKSVTLTLRASPKWNAGGLAVSRSWQND